MKFENYERTLFKAFLGLSLGAIFFMTLLTQTRLSECLSDSLNGVRYILFLKSSFLGKGFPIHHGDIVCIVGHREDHVGSLKHWPYSKRVIGLPGDKITLDKEGIHLNNQTFPLHIQTSKGKPLTPLTPTTIPEGMLFVAGDNPHSFDSRYEEFGLVSQEKIWGKALFLW